MQRNRVRAIKQIAHTRQSALSPMRSAECRQRSCLSFGLHKNASEALTSTLPSKNIHSKIESRTGGSPFLIRGAIVEDFFVRFL